MRDEKATVESLSAYRVGQVVKAVSAELARGKTTPPPRYSEDTLIRDMENASKFARTQQERDMLKQTEGIGTARTRGPTLSNLLKRKLLISNKVGKKHELRSSPIGREMIGRLPAWLTDVTTTARWEMLLGAVEKGEVASDAVLKSQVEHVNQIIERAKGQSKPIKKPK